MNGTLDNLYYQRLALNVGLPTGISQSGRGSKKMVHNNNNEPLHLVRQGAANFLAGIFLIVVIFQPITPADSLNPRNYPTLAVGIILVVTGFAIILASFPKLSSYKERIRKYEPYWFFTLYTITMIQLFMKVIEFYQANSPILLYVTVVFILLVLLSLMFMSKRLFQEVRAQVVAALLLNAFSVISILMALNNLQSVIIQVIAYNSISLILLFMAFRKLEAKKDTDKEPEV